MTPIQKLKDLLEFKCLKELDDTKKGLISSGGLHAILLSIVATVTLSRPKPKEDPKIPTVDMIDRVELPEAPKSGSGEPIQTVTASFIQNLQKNTPSVPQNDPLQDALKASNTHNPILAFNEDVNAIVAPAWAPTEQQLHQRRQREKKEEVEQWFKDSKKRAEDALGITEEKEALRNETYIKGTSAKTSRTTYSGAYGYIPLEDIPEGKGQAYPPKQDPLKGQNILLLTEHYKEFTLTVEHKGKPIVEDGPKKLQVIDEIVQKLKQNNQVTHISDYLTSHTFTMPDDEHALEGGALITILPSQKGGFYHGPTATNLDISIPMHLAEELKAQEHDLIVIITAGQQFYEAESDKLEVQRFLPYLSKAKTRIYVISIAEINGTGKYPDSYKYLLEATGGAFMNHKEFLQKISR